MSATNDKDAIFDYKEYITPELGETFTDNKIIQGQTMQALGYGFLKVISDNGSSLLWPSSILYQTPMKRLYLRINTFILPILLQKSQLL